MVDGILAQSHDEQVTELATGMRKTQLSEVQALESLLKALNAPTK